MSCIIYGTGKWAKLLGDKLKANNLDPIYIGSDSAVSTYTRKTIPDDVLNAKNPGLIFIASSTKNHLSDLKHCLENFKNVSKIFIEKGFTNNEERDEAKTLIKSKKARAYILSQYRFSKVFKDFRKLGLKIESITYNWHVEKGEASEWGHHIVSLDNFLKNQSSDMVIDKFGIHQKENSVINLVKSDERKLLIDVETTTSSLRFSLGKDNEVTIITKDNFEGYAKHKNEDCLELQVQSILKRMYDILEKV